MPTVLVNNTLVSKGHLESHLFLQTEILKCDRFFFKDLSLSSYKKVCQENVISRDLYVVPFDKKSRIKRSIKEIVLNKINKTST